MGPHSAMIQSDFPASTGTDIVLHSKRPSRATQPPTKSSLHHNNIICISQQTLLHSFMMMAADGYYTFTGREGEIIPPGVTRVRIHESVSVIPARAFRGNRNIEELECHDRVKTVESHVFRLCPSLRRVIMPGVEVVEQYAFDGCKALAIVECGKLEIIG
eukprot:scaffold7538_cov235-Skeletonema_marinoi.AAC.1